MGSSLRAELRKLFSVRSTYIFVVAGIAISVFLSGFVFGYRDAGNAVTSADALQQSLMIGAVGVLVTVVSIIAILQVGHEYRYNTILYSLTNTRSRARLLIAKWLVVTVFSVAAALVAAALSYGAFYAGQALGGHNPIPQQFDVLDMTWRMVLSVAINVGFAFVIALLMRNLIAAVVVYLIAPGTIESLLAYLLKDGAQYLPFTAAGSILMPTGNMTLLTSVLVASAYAVVAGVIGYILFLKRDAN